MNVVGHDAERKDVHSFLGDKKSVAIDYDILD
jgi:hypothetical protein